MSKNNLACVLFLVELCTLLIQILGHLASAFVQSTLQ